MPHYHPLIYSVHDGGANGQTVEADSPEEAFRKAAAGLLRLSLPEIETMIQQGELEVIAVIEGDPTFVPTHELPLFPGF